MKRRIPISMMLGLWIVGEAVTVHAAPPSRVDAARAAVHPVTTVAAMEHWLARVPQTRTFPPDFDATLRGHKRAFCNGPIVNPDSRDPVAGFMLLSAVAAKGAA